MLPARVVRELGAHKASAEELYRVLRSTKWTYQDLFSWIRKQKVPLQTSLLTAFIRFPFSKAAKGPAGFAIPHDRWFILNSANQLAANYLQAEDPAGALKVLSPWTRWRKECHFLAYNFARAYSQTGKTKAAMEQIRFLAAEEFESMEDLENDKELKALHPLAEFKQLFADWKEMYGVTTRATTAKQYAKNFGKLELPQPLERLLEFQDKLDGETFADGFVLAYDDKALLKGFRGADGRPVASRSKQKAFLAAMLPIATANGTGSAYFAWSNGNTKNVSQMPVVVFGDEGGCHIVAEDLTRLLQIAAADIEPLITFDDVSYFRPASGYQPSPKIRAFRQWLKKELGVAPAKQPDHVVRAAQRTYKSAFDVWLKRLRA
jgi:hypothetical protein